ncbi:MAG TPA: hypothetical protein VGI39_16165 [Polyangiaceae bacterium]|jgi:hypothetical protein
MVAPHETEINLDAYARLYVALSRAGARREEVLTAHGLDEARWQTIDDGWQARLSDALDQGTDEVPIPPFLAEFSRAMDRAQSDDSQPISFEKFVEATRIVRRGGDLTKTLLTLGLTTEEYVRGNRFWMQRMAKDDELSARFQGALG